MRAYLPLIRKDSTTHMHSLAVYVKERLPFAQDLSLENSADSYLRFRLAFAPVSEFCEWVQVGIDIYYTSS